MTAAARTLNANNAAELAEWCGGRVVVEHDALDSDKTSPGINVPVGRGIGVKRASLGDVIVQKHDGTFDVVKRGHLEL
jgi:hypothetical protein